MKCAWCGETIDGWYLTYKGNVFCREKNDSCLKEYLLEEADEEIGMNRIGSCHNEDLERGESVWTRKD